MKVQIALTLPTFSGGEVRFMVRLPHAGTEVRANEFTVNDEQNDQRNEPVRAIGYYERESGNMAADDGLVWLFKNRVVTVEPPYDFSLDEMILSVKHAVICQEQVFAEMRSEIARFERLAEAGRTPREPIPADVRSFVWRRDGGQCVRCESRERLEYDHIIPLAKGGSNTERNIQLLCEACNRSKGTTI